MYYSCVKRQQLFKKPEQLRLLETIQQIYNNKIYKIVTVAPKYMSVYIQLVSMFMYPLYDITYVLCQCFFIKVLVI